MDDTKLHKLIATTKTTSKNATKYDKHNSHLPFSVLSNDDLKSLKVLTQTVSLLLGILILLETWAN